MFTNSKPWHGLVNNKDYLCWNTERNSQMTKKHWAKFLQDLMYFYACVVGSFSRELQFCFFEQNIMDAELGIENYRFPLGLTSGEVLQQLSKGDYFYGTALQGQEFS